jgi:glycyl-radical enzyme activating protein
VTAPASTNVPAGADAAPANPVARLFDIKKMAVHDGPGIRTTVFFKGCPLKCQWCHSPESMGRHQQIRFVENLCQSCGNCVTACPNACHRIDGMGVHVYDRTDCVTCGKCLETCAISALGMIGYDASLEEVAKEVLKDKKYYDASGGGVTFSGGEAMVQARFVTALARHLKGEGVHVALDTCGYAPWESYAEVLEHVDLVLFDFKVTDPAKHREYTGVDNARILENLQRINASGTEIHLRCPLIPGLNDTPDHFAKIGELAESLENVSIVHVLPFHPFGRSKSEMIGEKYPLAHIPTVEDSTAEEWIERLQKITSKPVKRG